MIKGKSGVWRRNCDGFKDPPRQVTLKRQEVGGRKPSFPHPLGGAIAWGFGGSGKRQGLERKTSLAPERSPNPQPKSLDLPSTEPFTALKG